MAKCPISQQPCDKSKCTWWVASERLCAITNLSQKISSMSIFIQNAFAVTAALRMLSNLPPHWTEKINEHTESKKEGG